MPIDHDPRSTNDGIKSNPWRLPPVEAGDGTSHAGWLDRTFGIKTAAGRLGCVATVAAIIAIPIAGVSFCSNAMERHAAEEARAAAEQQAASDKDAHNRYEQSLADGSVCADGSDGSNLALVDAVKRNLRDPDSFQHVKTVIGQKNDRSQYPTMMEYRAKNGFGGYNVSLVHARLRVKGVAGCAIDSPLSREQ